MVWEDGGREGRAPHAMVPRITFCTRIDAASFAGMLRNGTTHVCAADCVELPPVRYSTAYARIRHHIRSFHGRGRDQEEPLHREPRARRDRRGSPRVHRGGACREPHGAPQRLRLRDARCERGAWTDALFRRQGASEDRRASHAFGPCGPCAGRAGVWVMRAAWAVPTAQVVRVVRGLCGSYAVMRRRP